MGNIIRTGMGVVNVLTRVLYLYFEGVYGNFVYQKNGNFGVTMFLHLLGHLFDPLTHGSMVHLTTTIRGVRQGYKRLDKDTTLRGRRLMVVQRFMGLTRGPFNIFSGFIGGL